jgi:4-hydroxybenzoate polyprenyltransferase
MMRRVELEREATTAGGTAMEQTLLRWQAVARQRMAWLVDSRVGALVAQSRPWFWPVGWVPAYTGAVVASGSWLPGPAGMTRALLALLVIGPLVWGAVLVQNDLHDLPTDRANRRKTTAPLVLGTVTARRLPLLYWLLVVAAVGTALLIGPLYALGVATVLTLGWAYSAPPLRLKTRPGADVAANAFVLGVLAPLAGWSLTRPPWQFPWLLGLFGTLFAAAFYLPTTVVDLPADRSVGDTTFAVRFGPRFTYRLGIVLWTLALASALVCAWLDLFVPRSTVPYQVLMAPLLAVAYATLTRRPSTVRLALLSALFLVPVVGFLGGYLTRPG